jgi:dipeptidyl-peptidase-4
LRLISKLVGGCAALFLCLPAQAAAQDRLPGMPGAERYQEVGPKIRASFRSGALSVQWMEEGKALEFRRGSTTFHFDIAARSLSELPPAAPTAGETGNGGGRGRGAGGGGGPERGRQISSAPSPDGKLLAFCRDRNFWISDADGGHEIAVTKDGDAAKRIKYATASWVYGEELGQVTAFWWSPDGKQVAFYRFDESAALDYYLALDQTKIQSSMDVEAYPKAGAPNPVADLLIYDLDRKKIVEVDARAGQPFSDTVVGHYVYGVSWSPDGEELLFRRTNRHQSVMEFAACNPKTGKTRVIVREEWPDSWTNNSPGIRWLADKKRFIWTSERTGWSNYYLYDVSGKLIAPLTQHEFEVAGIERVDEDAGQLWYMARDGDNHMKLQLHRVGLNGKGDQRLTDPAFNHSVSIAPDGRHFTDVAQTHDQPPVTRLMTAEGKEVAELAQSDLAVYDELGLKRVELISYLAADGQTELHGLLHFPSNFDPAKKYPLLVSVYAGPGATGANERFTLPSGLTEYGFLVATLDSRSASGRGKRFMDAIYQKLGVVEVDDQAAGVRSLWDRPYLDRERVGIHGTSYGGYVSALCLLRHPDAFQAACASSAVTDWRHYDTIYTERYMRTPQENPEGYDAGSAMKHAANLKGRLMIYYGTADNNVHPANAMQLIEALQAAGKSFEVQVGPDRGHTGLNTERMMEFFIENLVLR